MNNFDNKYILNILINNLIPNSCRSNPKTEFNELDKIINYLIKTWEKKSYNIDNIVQLFQERTLHKELIYLNTIDDYIPIFNENNNLIHKYKLHVINVFNQESENIEEIYNKLNNTQQFKNNEILEIKYFLNKYKKNKIYIGMNDNVYNCFYLLSFETPYSIINNDSFFSLFTLDKPLYKLNIYMILLIKK
jgi:hypothetical protein